MHGESIIFSLFLIFTGAAFIATLALFARQSLIVAYILLGIILGPWGVAWVSDTNLIKEISNVGIIFLLFLLGLNLSPRKLLDLFKQTTIVTLSTCLVFSVVGWAIAVLFGFDMQNALIVGVACMFSSTITGPEGSNTGFSRNTCSCQHHNRLIIHLFF